VAALGNRPALSFRDTLAQHLGAIRSRDLDALAATVAPDELVLITAEGRLKRSAREFLEAHRAWFEMKGEKRGDRWLMVLDQNTPTR
jgi:hypothetical protein